MPDLDRYNPSGVTRDDGGPPSRPTFEGFFCDCGCDAFLQLHRFATDASVPQPGAFGTNNRVKCAGCGAFYVFRGGLWVRANSTFRPMSPDPSDTKTRPATRARKARG